jgi:transmembrane sensor
MEKFNNIEERVIRIFQKDASEEDIQQVDAWRKESTANEEVYREYHKTWQLWDNYSDMLNVDTDKAAKKLERKLGTSKSPNRIWMAYALTASVLLPLAIGTFLYFYLQSPASSRFTPTQKVITAYGTRKQVLLPDSSVVWLNAGSSIEFPMAFSSDRREVILSGEGYFDVVKNPKVPFYVKAENMYVKALGTEFNVKAYPGDKRIETTLLSGSVHLVQKRGREEKLLAEMSPNQHIIYDKQAHKMMLIEETERPTSSDRKEKNPAKNISSLPPIDAQVEVNKHTAWVAGKLVFRDDSMEEIARRLGRWYNVDITLKSDLLKEYSYTATFTDETLEQVLELLKLTAPMDYTIIDRKKTGETIYTKKEVIIDMKR